MRFGTLLSVLCVFSSGFAAPTSNIHARDTKVILSSITSITKSLQDESATLNALYKNPTSADIIRQLKSKASAVTAEMRKGASSVASGPNVDMLEALSLVGPLASLNSASETAISAWVYDKATIVKSGGKEQVIDILREQNVAADKFTDAVVGKMPELYRYVGLQYGDSVSKRLQNAISQFRSA
jgi:hypothetical protein